MVEKAVEEAFAALFALTDLRQFSETPSLPVNSTVSKRGRLGRSLRK